MLVNKKDVLSVLLEFLGWALAVLLVLVVLTMCFDRGRQVFCSHKYTISSTGFTNAGLLREKMRCEHCNKTLSLPVRG